MSGFDYTFQPDGTYTTKMGGSVSSKTAKSTVTASTSGAGAGRYSIDGNKLILTPTGGSARTHFLFYVPTSTGDKTPDMIIIDGVVATKSR